MTPYRLQLLRARVTAVRNLCERAALHKRHRVTILHQAMRELTGLELELRMAQAEAFEEDQDGGAPA